eukprot:TRINITY_DN2974_c0_g1_i2.p1 TRINITY_DN2974_c0_g1~~TRINITY_DN2974_c0_g1_i2.p1  ORF type:complete len:312 (-),score=99.54 TRINITY_DN2974_c0_g1_i2:993-1928(-)
MPSHVQTTTFYEVLGVERDASSAQIKRAYKKACLLHHPDKNPNDKEEAEKRFKDINEAYETLSDDQKRFAYDNSFHQSSSRDRHGHQRSRNSYYNDQYGSEQNDWDEPSATRQRHSQYAGRQQQPFQDFFGDTFFDSFFGGAPMRQGSGGARSGSLFGGSMFDQSPFGMAGFGAPFASMFDSGFDSAFSGGGGGGAAAAGFSGPAAYQDAPAPGTRVSRTTSWGPSGAGRSVRVTSYTNSAGQRTSVTETTVTHADGTSETTREETVSGGGGGGGGGRGSYRLPIGGAQQQQQQQQRQRQSASAWGYSSRY